ncbi:Odorant receptor, partial [Operophtera brumata]
MALCRCRLRLSAFALKNLCSGINISKHLLTSDQETIIRSRLRVTVMRHQAALRAADEIEACFTEPILGQFAVSMVIICVTAYQLAVSSEIAYAAYECPWYSCSLGFRRALLVVM